MTSSLKEISQFLKNHRPPSAHKGQCGRIGIIAGSSQMMGAAVLTAKAALRSGAGLVTLFTLETAQSQLNILTPEIIVHPLPSKNGYLTIEGIHTIVSYLESHTLNAIAIGPGLGRKKSTASLVQELVRKLAPHYPFIIDADGLNALTLKDFDALPPNSCVLTPHPGEFKSLFYPDSPLKFTPESRIEYTQKAAASCGQVVILKGHQTVISDRQNYDINLTGNSGMATAGSGDVLTGMIAALVGQGLSPYAAARCGTYLHGLAGDLATKEISPFTLLASDLLSYLSHAFLYLEQNA